MVLFSAVWCSTMQPRGVQHSAVWWSAVQCVLVQGGLLECGEVQCIGVVQYISAVHHCFSTVVLQCGKV